MTESLKAQSSKLKAQSSKLKAQSSKLKAQSSKLKAQSSKLKSKRQRLLAKCSTIGRISLLDDQQAQHQGHLIGLRPKSDFASQYVGPVPHALQPECEQPWLALARVWSFSQLSPVVLICSDS
ncbi:TPA: hypothetical protein SL654_002985 [Pseudomonas aeruginosa]|nr:hypothetical protein [Pseudomonas aeruginosa]